MCHLLRNYKIAQRTKLKFYNYFYIDFQFFFFRNNRLVGSLIRNLSQRNNNIFHRMIKEQKQQNMAKIQTELHFSKIFDDLSNSSCFQCGKQCRQWVQTRHAIYLCLSCAAAYRDIPRVVNIKSVTLDLWSIQQLENLKRGGNPKFKQYLRNYGLQGQNPEFVLRSKAAEFYRLYLLNPQKLSLENAPSIQQGHNIHSSEVALTQMTPNEIIQEAKVKLSKAGQATLFYGNVAYDKIHHKITSGQIKQDAAKVAEKVNETAKTIWAFVANKIGEIQAPQNSTVSAYR